MVVVHRVVIATFYLCRILILLWWYMAMKIKVDLCIYAYGDGDDDVDRDWTCSELPLYQDTKFQILMIFRFYKV